MLSKLHGLAGEAGARSVVDISEMRGSSAVERPLPEDRHFFTEPKRLTTEERLLGRGEPETSGEIFTLFPAGEGMGVGGPRGTRGGLSSKSHPEDASP